MIDEKKIETQEITLGDEGSDVRDPLEQKEILPGFAGAPIPGKLYAINAPSDSLAKAKQEIAEALARDRDGEVQGPEEGDPLTIPLDQDAEKRAEAKVRTSQELTTSTSAVPKVGSVTLPQAKPIMSAPRTIAAPTTGIIGVPAAAPQPMKVPLKMPKSLHKFNTTSLRSSWFHGIIYAPTNMRKSSIAAMFGDAKSTRIILTRRPEQLIALTDLGYEAVCCEDAEAFKFACLNPEEVWPEWKGDGRVLVIDDVTEAVNLILDDSEGKGFAIYNAAGAEMREITRHLFRQPFHVVEVALADVRENPLTNEETVFPKLPPSMLSALTTEVEFTFFIEGNDYHFLTQKKIFNYQGRDDSGKTKTYIRTIFAKTKFPIGQSPLKPSEPGDLKAVWQKILSGRPPVTVAAAKTQLPTGLKTAPSVAQQKAPAVAAAKPPVKKV